MSNDIYYIPYTYLIKFKPTNQVYYGVRFAKGCLPDDLWKTYFTSSKVIKSLIEEHGKDAFDYEIRKTFDTVDAAREWETQVLQRMNVVNDDKWLNKTDNIAARPVYRENLSDKTRQKLSDTKKGKNNPMYGKKPHNYGKSLSNEMKQKISVSLKNRFISDETKQKMSDSHKGHKHSVETRQKISNAKKGILRSEETKEKLKNTLFKCDQCDFTSNAGNVAKHHKTTGHIGRSRVNLN